MESRRAVEAAVRRQMKNARLKIIDRAEARRDSLTAIIGIANVYI